MKYFILLTGLTISAIEVTYAQTDSLKFSRTHQSGFELDSLSKNQWLDLNNDDNLELVTIYQSNDFTRIIRHLPDTAKETIETDTLSLKFISDNLYFTNLDNDHGLDIINYLENTLKIYYHQDSLNYDSIEWVLPDLIIETLQTADLNQNGKEELLITGTQAGERKIMILELKDGNWQVTPIEINPDLVTIATFEEVGPTKIISFANDSLYVHSFDRTQKLVLDSSRPFLSRVTAVNQGDLNSNQQFDLLLTAEETPGNPMTYIYYDFKEIVLLDSIPFELLLAADLNSDGLTDVYAEKDSLKYYFQLSSAADFKKQVLDTLTSMEISFGDYDNDGDLDLSAMDFRFNIITINSNESGINEAPLPPDFVITFQGNDGIALYWPEGTDDHSEILTYDLDIRPDVSGSGYQVGLFNPENGFRRGVKHGNMTTQRFGEFMEFPTGAFEIRVQAIDNSFYGSEFFEGSGVRCDEVMEQNITLCKNETFQFTNNNAISHWYSRNQGYLGLSDTLNFLASENDVLYTVAEGATLCDDYQVWNIEIIESGNFSLIEDFFGCEGEPIQVDVSGFNITFDSIFWQIKNNNEFIPLFPDSLVTQFEFATLNETEIYVDAFVGSCVIRDSASYIISEPSVTITTRFSEILPGGSVSISATPGYDYSWTPPEGLDNPAISNPIASPETSTTYFADITDSLGCMLRDSVIIEVIQTGMMAELFTPNNDGRNDRLILHQLTRSDGFLFEVIDKRGNQVYQTNSISELISGWDGTSNGNKLPSGTYFWKVQGTDEKGDPVLINQVKKGFVNLVR